jgi:hypothetical protein
MDTKSTHTQHRTQRRYAPGSSRGTRSATTLLAQVADIERGQRIRGRREELHLTQPAVVDLLEEAAAELPPTHELHPAKAGKAPVTLRGYQTYEQGGGIVWEKAKLLAQVLQIDVQTMMSGEPERTVINGKVVQDASVTPSPFPDGDSGGHTASAGRRGRCHPRTSRRCSTDGKRARAASQVGVGASGSPSARTWISTPKTISAHIRSRSVVSVSVSTFSPAFFPVTDGASLLALLSR